ncbi:DUF6273 domain-containing protein [Anaerobutyricum hallii]|uniref:DUF6273 domain-containing protein n=1 Tax=Anaerobutyricum hallii TaxID=39488 RepID=UPI0024939A42|nr:DUF6273 domain-containing protein [Anaerobutyricum hallii]
MKKQRKHINLSRITAFILSVAMLAGFCPQGVSFADIPITLPKVNAAENISNPRIVKDSSMEAGQKVTWDCVYFGSYPQSEITSKDGSIYNALKNATGWDENNDITIGRTKYRRLKGEDATYASSDDEEQYNWNYNYKTYHYFKYEPIKWRVLNRNGNDALLLADIALDDQKYNTDYAKVTWEMSSIRSWLNGYGASMNEPETDYGKKNFINSAFTFTQRNAINTTIVANNNNIDYEIVGGSNTSDKIFLLSESEVYNTDMAAGYGFVKDNFRDEARRSRCSTYTYAMGTSRFYNQNLSKYNENIYWWLRSSTTSDFAFVYEVEAEGHVDCFFSYNNHVGVRPALHLNLSSSNLYSYAGTVCSDAMKSGESGTDNPVNPSEPDESDTPNQPAHPDKPGTATGTRTEESNVDIEIDGGVDFTIPENVPILGGGDVSLDYGTIPVTFKREDNTYRIGIGVQDMNKKDWTTFKKFVETQKESYRKGMNSLLASKFGTASMGMSVEPEMEAYGYVEGTITKKNGVESAGGKLVVEIKGTAKQEWQTFVVVVPVVIKVKGTAGTKADFSVGFDFNKSKVYTKGKVELTLPSVRLTGGIGVSYIADISVYGEAKNLVTVESNGKDNDITASLEGAMGVSAKALCLSYEKEILNGSLDYYSSKKKSKARMYARVLPKLEPEAKDYEIQRVDSSSWDGSAVAEQTAKPRSIKRAASAKNISGTVTTLLSDVYASAKPQLLQTASGKKLLIFTTDMGDRTTGNHTAVVYSIYNERGWSIPKLIDDDGTADFDAVAAVDGENVYVTWINAKRTFTTAEAGADDFMTKLAAETEVYAAKIALNGNTGTVTKYPAITDNAIADLHPAITVKNHVPYIAWNSNSANDILKGTGTNTVYLASLNGNAFTTKKLSEENKPVQSVAIGNLDNDVVTAYTLNSGTEENPQVQLAAVNAKGRTTIAANGQDLSPSFAKIDGSSVLLWYAQDAGGSSLNYIDAIDGAVESYIEDDAVISADYTVVDGGDSQLLICSSEKENAEETGRNLYAYVIRDGEVYEPVTLTDLEGYAAVPSGIWNGTAYEYLFTRTDVDITENTVTENTDLCITSVVPQSKLVIGDIDYTQEKLMPDEDTSITIPVKNNGLTNCSEGRVQIVYNGNVIGQADLENGITSGETQNVTVDLTVPEDAVAKETLKVEAISDKNTTADSTKNIQSAGSELALSVEQEDDNITAIVDNNSAFDTTAALTLKAGDASSKVLKTINLGNVESYDTVEKTFTKEELKKLGSDTVYMEVSGDAEESIKSDNTAFVYVGTEELKTLDYLTATKTKVTYTKGEKLNLNDLEVTAVYTDGSKAKVTGYTTNVKNIDMSKTGKKQLEILYEEVGIGRKVVMPITVENAKPNTPKPDTGKKPSKKVKVTSIRLSGLSKQIAAGKKLTLKAAVLPKTSSNKKLLWKSSNTKVATVTQGGVVTLKKKTGGKKVTITATATDGSKKYASWKITSMKGIVKKIKITGSKPVKAGKKLKLKAKVSATKKANKKLLWISSNTKYATVNAKGIVTTKKSARGKTVKITAMATDGSGKKKTVKIKMK